MTFPHVTLSQFFLSAALLFSPLALTAQDKESLVDESAPPKTTITTVPKPSTEETIWIHLDSDNWKVARSETGDDFGLVELVRPSENILNWTELVSIHWYNNSEISASQWASAFLQGIKASVMDQGTERQKIFKSKKSKKSDSVFFQWMILEDGLPNNQFELVRATKTGTTLWIASYTTKNTQNLVQTKKTWIPLLQELAVTTPEAPNPVEDDPRLWYSVSNRSPKSTDDSESVCSPPVGWYGNDEKGFAMSLPENWKYVEVDDDFRKELHNSTIVLLATPHDEKALISISIVEAPAEVTNLKELYKHELSESLKSSDKVTIGKNGQMTTLQGKLFDYYVATTSDENKTMTFVASCLEGQRIFSIHCSCPAKDFADYERTFEEIASNFIFF